MTASVTVVIPAWGHYVERYLLRAVASVRGCDQAGDIQIAVVDNANPPGTVFPEGVRLIRSDTRLTVGSIRNYALAHVDTEFVVFLDADDELCPSALATLRAAFGEHPKAVAVAGSLLDRRTGSRYHWPRSWTYRLSCRRWLLMLAECVRPCFPMQGAMLRTDVVRASPGYATSEDHTEDWVIGLSLALRGEVVLLKAPVVVYEPAPGGIWQSLGYGRAEALGQAGVRDRLRRDPAAPWWAMPLPALLVPVHAVDRVRRTWMMGRRRRRASPAS